MAQRNRTMGRWLWWDFWLTHLGVVCFYAADLGGIFWGPQGYTALIAGSYGCSILGGLIFLKLADLENAFALPGYIGLVNQLTQVGLRLFGLGGYIETYQILFTLADFLCIYYSYLAYESALLYADRVLGRKWPLLWKCFIVSYAARMLFSYPINFLVNGLYALSELSLFVCAILESVYLFRTARILKNFQDIH